MANTTSHSQLRRAIAGTTVLRSSTSVATYGTVCTVCIAFFPCMFRSLHLSDILRAVPCALPAVVIQDHEEKLLRCGAHPASGTAGQTNWQPRQERQEGQNAKSISTGGMTHSGNGRRTRNEQIPIPDGWLKRLRTR